MKKGEFLVLFLLFTAIFLAYEFIEYKQTELNFYKEKSAELDSTANHYFYKYLDCKNGGN